VHAAGGGEPAQGGGGFLDSMRNVIMGQPRGSVPTVRPGGQGSSGVWGTRPEPSQADAYPQQPGYPQQAGYPQGGPMGGGMMGGGMMGAPGMGGGSFLGTAAATVAGVVGGAMLLNGIRSMMGGHQAFGGDYDRGNLGASHAASPWDSGGSSSGDLARDAGLGDIGGGGHRAASYDDSARSGLLAGNDDQPVDQPDDDYDTDDAGDFDGGGDSDTA
jgi:predicted lipid-binding transport protein (Tim44 family)